MNDEELRDYLKRFCFGREHLICSRDLVRQKNLRESDLRKKVNRLRRKAVPIASSREGYFYASNAAELYSTIRQLKEMRAGLDAAICGLEQAMANFCGEAGRGWPGSLGRLSLDRQQGKADPYIWQVFPPSPKLYLEPFGGASASLLGMQPRSAAWTSTRFQLRPCKSRSSARENARSASAGAEIPPLHSRTEFDLLKEFMKHKELLQQRIVDERNAVMECFSGEEREELLEILRERSCLFDVQRAAAYYKVCRGSFSGTTSSFGVRPNNLTNFLYLFDDASKRLQDVVIENKDCLDIIRERDGPDSLIYCDPPYFDAESLYAVDFPKEKHEELHHILSQCAGYIVVSYNDCPFIRSLYGDFFILAFRRNNPLSQKPGATYGELIITNYDPRPYIQPQFSMFPAEIENGDLVLVHEPTCGSLREINLARREKELGH